MKDMQAIFLAVSLFVGILLGGGYSLRILCRKIGHPQIGISLSRILGLCTCSVAAVIIFHDSFFTPKDARTLIETHQIVLADSFSLESHCSKWNFDNNCLTFTLKISDSDKAFAMEEIRNAPTLVHEECTTNFLTRRKNDRKEEAPRQQNYETDSTLVREYHIPNDDGTAPVLYTIITIDKKSNFLFYKNIQMH